MAYEFKLRRRVEFAETDMAGIVHFANFFRYMEQAEHAFFRSLGFGVHGEVDGRLISWPRVNVTCRYLAPLRFEDEFEVRVLVREKKAKALVCAYRVRKLDTGASEPTRDVARGEMTIVCVELDRAGGPLKAVEIPPAIGGLIDEAPASLFEDEEPNE